MTIKYISATKGELVVADMQWNHLINTKKKLLRDWAAIAALQTIQEPLFNDPNCNPSTESRITQDPSFVFPVYDTICSEIDARTEAKALSKALEETSNANSPI